MPRQIIPLSARKVDGTKPTEKAQSLFDGGGLFLLIAPQKYTQNGKPLPALKGWRFKYRFGGKPCLISLGIYPDITLEEARERRQEARNLIAKGINPSDVRKQRKVTDSLAQEVQANTLEKIYRQWFDKQKMEWTAGHAKTIQSRIERDILPMLGHMLMSEITTRDVLAALRIVEARQAFETAHRIKTIIGQIFKFAKASSIPGVLSNPAEGLGQVLKQPQTKSMAAILDPVILGRLMVDIDNYPGTFIVRCALQLAPMLFVRPGELRHARWKDIDLEGAEWRLPVEDTKLLLEEKANQKGQMHTIPLSQQAVAVMQELHPFTNRSQYVFPGRAASRVMSGNTINSALRTMGWDSDTVCGHGFRATARTMLHETLGISPDAIEAQLGHRVPDRLGSAYNRTKHLDERRKMMQVWSDYLERLRYNAAESNQDNANLCQGAG